MQLISAEPSLECELISWVQNTCDYLIFARIWAYPWKTNVKVENWNGGLMRTFFTDFLCSERDAGWVCLTDGISLTVTSLSGGKENLLWSCGMTCVPVDPGQKAGLVAVELMDPDQSETLLDSSLDLSDCAQGQLNALKSQMLLFPVFHNNIWGSSDSLTSHSCTLFSPTDRKE